MLTTYGKVNRGDIIDGDVISKIDRWCAEDVEMTRLHTVSGGRRTECSDYPVTVQHHADPTLVNVDQVDLDQFVRAVNCSIGVVPAGWIIQALHGVALEENRRRAMDKIRAANVPQEEGCRVCVRKDRYAYL